MPKNLVKILLVLIDFLAINFSFFVWTWLRREMGFFSESNFSTLLYLSLLVYFYWFLIFNFFGMYSSWHAQSRIDEFISIIKSVTIGVLVIFLLTFDLEQDFSAPPKPSRMFIINYCVILIFFVSAARGIFRSIQRALLSSGIGHRRTLIVGWDTKSWKLSDQISRFPALGYKVVGFIGDKDVALEKNAKYKEIPLLGNIDELEGIVEKIKAQEIIFALKGSLRRNVLDVMDKFNGQPINFKIVPDLYDIVMGRARTNQIYGFPLIDISPQLMPEWQRIVKRFMDIIISILILILFSPLWLLIALLIKLDSKGPVLYKQERVGKNGKIYTMYKFRSMIKDAESLTGPQWAQKEDPRITRVGRIIRKPRLDEAPQFINVLKGEMSLIGPRPERPYFVEKIKHQVPFYTRRLQVKPGITGWAQIKAGYDVSMDNVKTKLKYDLFYLENMSLRMDLKILLNTIYVMLIGKGH